MNALNLTAKYEDYITGLRRWFHENPELSGKEYETIRKIDAELTAMGIEHTIVENGGILGWIHGKNPNGKTVLLRADCDALPVLEKENLNGTRACWSKNEGVMHACGHDAHTAMLLGAARALLDCQDELEGDVLLCFERGEESGGNVKYLFAYMEQQGIHVDSCFGLHANVPAPTGSIIINDTDTLAGSMGFEVTLEGQGGHGSRPDQANNPIDCFFAIYQRLEALRLTSIDPFKTCTYSVGSLHAGKQGNVIPQTLTFSGSMRCFDSEGVGMTFYKEFRHVIDCTAEAYHCKVRYDRYTLPGLATVNDIECSAFAKRILAEEFGADHILTAEPQMGSESFSQYLKQWPGVFGLLGVHNPEKGTGAANHNEAFDVDEAALKYGAAAHVKYAVEFLRSDFQTTHQEKLTFREILERQGRNADLEELYQ